MNDIMKAIGILQSLLGTLKIRHTPKVPYGVDLSDEIDQLQEAITLLSPPAEEPAGEPKQQPDTPPAFGPWQSCADGIDAEDGEWICLAWNDDTVWGYVAAQVSCNVDEEDGSEWIELLDSDRDRIEWEQAEFYMRVERWRTLTNEHL